MNTLKLSDLQHISEFCDVTAVWLFEQPEGGYALSIDYLNKETESQRGILYGQQNNIRIWKSVDRAIAFWKRYVPEYTDLNIKLIDRIKLIDPFGEIENEKIY